MALKLVVGDIIEFPVKGEVNNGPAPVPFSFKLRATRLDTDQYRAVLAPDSDVKTRDFLRENITGWTGQRLVVDGDEPASFSHEALALLLSLVGMEGTVLDAYLNALVIGGTPEGRAKNSR